MTGTVWCYEYRYALTSWIYVMNFLQTAQRSVHNSTLFVGFPRLSLIQHARYLTHNSVTSCLPSLIIPLRMWDCYIITDTT